MDDYGVLGPIVIHAGSLMATVGALAFGFKRRARWEPSEEDISLGPQRVASLMSAVAVAVVWSTRRFPTSSGLLIGLSIACAALTFFALIAYGLLVGVQTYYRETVKENVVVRQNVIGGFSLNVEAKEALRRAREQNPSLTIQELFKGAAYDVDKMWHRLSRSLAKQLFVISYIMLVSCGTVALASAAILVGLSMELHSATPPTTKQASSPLLSAESNVDLTNQPAQAWEGAFAITAPHVAYASPDNTWTVVRERLGEAQESISIGMYDFNAPYVAEILLQALGRKVRVSLVISRSSADSPEGRILDDLRKHGADIVEIGRTSRFDTYHPKVIVIDRKWTLVQSANLTLTGTPDQETGNRDTGVAIESKDLAEYFSGLLEEDKKYARETNGADRRTDEVDRTYARYIPIPRFEALKAGFPGKGNETTLTASSMRVLPLLVPDNYISVLPAVLAAARESIDLELQYIRPGGTNRVKELLDSVKQAQRQNPNLRIRIIVTAPPLAEVAAKELERYKEILGRLYDWHLDSHVRFLNPRSGRNLTNRMIIIDRKVSVVGSANWTEAGVSRNREVCLLVAARDVAEYFTKIFQADWNVGLKAPAIDGE